MKDKSTIFLDKRIISLLKKAKEHKRQTYNELLENALKLYLRMKKRDQYNKFLHEIQKPKMKELWDNKEDEIWNKV